VFVPHSLNNMMWSFKGVVLLRTKTEGQGVMVSLIICREFRFLQSLIDKNLLKKVNELNLKPTLFCKPLTTVRHKGVIGMAATLPSNLKIVLIALEFCSQEMKLLVPASIRLSSNSTTPRHIKGSLKMLSSAKTSTMDSEAQSVMSGIIRSTLRPY